jgi:hypothetical protein
LEKKKIIEEGSVSLWEYTKSLLEEAAERGYITDE